MNRKSIKIAVTIICALIIILVCASVAFIIANSKNEADRSSNEESVKSSESTITPDDSAEDVSELETLENSEAESSEDVLSDADADTIISTFANIGETYTLHGHYYEQSEDSSDDEISDSFFEGDMELCVNEVTLLDYSDEYFSSNESADIDASVFENPKVLKVELSLTNVNAANPAGVQYEFNSTIFGLSAYKDLIAENADNAEYIKISDYYFYPEFALEPHGEGNSYYHFEINPGETKSFTYYFLIDEELLNQKQPFLKVAAGRYIKFGVLLPSELTNS